ncbi:MAG: hypothetical protein HYZ29_30040 [Myxococcales bacterium]|nr:hypothetical protein [Myxococcales bacterium]
MAGPRVAVFAVHVDPGLEPSLAALVERQLRNSVRALGYPLADSPTVAHVQAGVSGALTPERAAAMVHGAGSAHGIFARVSSQPGRYRVSVQVVSPGGPARAAEASGVSSDLYASIDQALRSILPAPQPVAPPPPAAPMAAPASAPVRAADEPFPEGRMRLALGGAAAFGVSPGPFQNYLAGARLDWRFSDQASLGMAAYYANLKGKAGRAHNVLPWALFEYRIDLGREWALPLRFASGYLPKNGPVVKTAAGVSVPLGEGLELSTELFAPTVWITHERAVLSLDVSAEIGVTF